MPGHSGGGGELLAQTLRGSFSVLAFHLRVQLRRDFEKLAVAGLPDLQERAGIQTPFHRTSLVEALFERLANQILLQPLAAGILQNASQPMQLLPVEAVQRILRIGHGALEI